MGDALGCSLSAMGHPKPSRPQQNAREGRNGKMETIHMGTMLANRIDELLTQRYVRGDWSRKVVKSNQQRKAGEVSTSHAVDLTVTQTVQGRRLSP